MLTGHRWQARTSFRVVMSDSMPVERYTERHVCLIPFIPGTNNSSAHLSAFSDIPDSPDLKTSSKLKRRSTQCVCSCSVGATDRPVGTACAGSTASMKRATTTLLDPPQIQSADTQHLDPILSMRAPATLDEGTCRACTVNV